MRKLFFILNLIFIFSMSIYSVDKEKSSSINIKNKTILVLPFYNEKNEKDYDYLSNTLTINLKSVLLQRNVTKFPYVDDINKRIEAANFNYKDLNNKDNALILAKRLNSNIVIYGSFSIENDNILINFNSSNVKSGQILLTEKYNDKVSEDMSGFLSYISKDFIEKLLEQKVYEFDSNKKNGTVDSEDKEKNKIKSNLIKRRLFPVNKVGIALFSTGGTFLLAGAPILIYDLVGYSDVLREKINGPKTDAGYADYDSTYNTFIALFASSTAITCTGIILLAVGIPLTFYRFKDTRITMNLELCNDIKLYFSYSFY